MGGIAPGPDSPRQDTVCTYLDLLEFYETQNKIVIIELLYPQTSVSFLKGSSVWLKKLSVELIDATRVFKAHSAELA